MGKGRVFHLGGRSWLGLAEGCGEVVWVLVGLGRVLELLSIGIATGFPRVLRLELGIERLLDLVDLGAKSHVGAEEEFDFAHGV